MRRRFLMLAALAPLAVAAAPVVEQEAIPGLPAVKVQDLHYGDVLFHFYQGDHFNSLVRLAAYRDQGRLAAHARDAEMLRGGLYLSLGHHREAREIFERLLADASTPPEVRDRAWFYLGKVLYASGLYEESDRALRQLARRLEGATCEGPVGTAGEQDRLYRFRTALGERVLVGWTVEATSRVELPAPVEHAEDRDGNELPVRGRRVDLEGAPRYFFVSEPQMAGFTTGC